mgnify:CR=1 FL=1
MRNKVKDIVVSAVSLMVIAGVTTAALAGTNALTAATIAARNEEAETAARQQVIDADTFEKQNLGDTTYYVALKDGGTVGYVFTAVATGKSAGLTVMTGIAADGTVTGVAVTDDNETAGYVDKVREGGLLDAFAGRTAETFELGKTIDGVSQATKTSRGITDGVNQAVAWYQTIKEAGSRG